MIDEYTKLMRIFRRKRIWLLIISLVIVIFGAAIILKLRQLMINDDSKSTSQSYSIVTADKRQRTYLVHTPLGYDSTHQYPVVVGLHGGFGNAEQFEKASHLSEKADAKGFIAVYGQGTALGAINAPTWNAGGCCGASAQDKNNVDDVGYVRAVIEKVRQDYSVNSSRVYVTGMSNGGMMANRLACEAADMFAGAAIVSGTIQIATCTPSRQIPIMIMHGTADDNVPYNGGQGSKAVNRSTYMSVEHEFIEWGTRNSCEGSVVATSIPSQSSDGITIDKLAYGHCAQTVVLYRVNGGGHEWPGGRQAGNALERKLPTRAVDATQTILDFFHL